MITYTRYEVTHRVNKILTKMERLDIITASDSLDILLELDRVFDEEVRLLKEKKDALKERIETN